MNLTYFDRRERDLFNGIFKKWMRRLKVDEIIDKRRTQSTVLLSSPVFREKAPYFWMLVLKRPQSEYI